MDVDLSDPISIWEYYIHGLEHLVPENDDPNLQMFVNAVTEIASDMKCFDKQNILMRLVIRKVILLTLVMC